jgi:hypothetical protein
VNILKGMKKAVHGLILISDSNMLPYAGEKNIPLSGE